MKRILGKVQEMRDQRSSLEKQLRDLIQQDDITSSLVTTDRADMKVTHARTHADTDTRMLERTSQSFDWLKLVLLGTKQ